MSIETYLQALLDVVAAASAVATADIALDKRGPQAGLIRGDVYFVDDSLLHFRELIDLESGPPQGCTVIIISALTLRLSSVTMTRRITPNCPISHTTSI